MKVFYCVLPFLFLSACLAPPFERQESASVKATENLAAQQAMTVRSVVESSPIPAVELTFGTNKIVIPSAATRTTEVTATGAQNAKSTEWLSWMVETRLPVSVSLFIGAVALWLLFMLVRSARRSSQAVKAVTDIADAGFARAIRYVREAGSDLSKLSRMEAILEAERGQVTRRR